MKRALIAIGVVALLAAGTTAYAHMYGWGGGPGYGGHMGQGYGQMWGYADKDTEKFLEETADVRRELHEKRFDLREAYRTGDEAKAEAIEKDVAELREKLREKGGFKAGPGRGYGRGLDRGYGPRAGGGYGYCGGPYGR
jgi:hypothetical protein